MVSRPGARTPRSRRDADLLVVPRLDRLARDLLVQETVLGRLRQHGREIRSVAEPDIDSDDPTRVLVRQVLGAIAKYERGVIKGRMLAGKAAKVSRGRLGRRQAPLRHQGRDGELVDDPDEKATVARILALHGDGLSLRGIIASLDAEGVRPREVASAGTRPRSAR